MYAGGITEVRKIAAIADTFHVPISPHNTKGPVGIIAATHLMASIPNVAPMEFVTGIEWRDEIIAEPLRVEDSCIVLPEGPGWGVELDMEGVEKYRSCLPAPPRVNLLNHPIRYYPIPPVSIPTPPHASSPSPGAADSNGLRPLPPPPGKTLSM